MLNKPQGFIINKVIVLVCLPLGVLLERNYKSSIIDSALRRARASRALTLKNVGKSNNTKRPVHAVTWDT